MKVLIDNEVLFEINETQKKVFEDAIFTEEIDEVLKGLIKWVVSHNYDEIFKRFKAEWEPKLEASGLKMIPTDKEEFAKLVFTQPDYKSRSQRETYIPRT